MTLRTQKSIRWPHKVVELPNEPCYMILTTTTVFIEGDERSRNNPGHGYPAHSEEYWRIECFDNEDDWVAEIKRREASRNKEPYKAIKAIPAIITTTISVDTKVEP